MRKILLFVLAVILFSACGSNANSQGVVNSDQKEYVEVLYFHGKKRCITCNAIERLAKEVLDENFPEQLKSKKVVFRVIDISTKEGSKIADKYEVTWSSLFINKWKDSKQTKNNMTDLGFLYAKNSPDVFKSQIKQKMDELLK